MKRRLARFSLLLALLAACTPSAPRTVRVSGGDEIAFVGDGSHLTFTGLGPRETVEEIITSTDVYGVKWRLEAKTRSDAGGKVVVDDHVYAAMSPATSAPRGAYFWGDAPQKFHVSVAGVQRTVRRQLLKHPVTRTAVTAGGLSGTLYDAHLPGRHPAVLLIGGSEGGEPGLLLPSVVAGYGYPVLALAYFKAPGLPGSLQNVRLEYFRSALQWMSRQQDIDPRHLYVHGVSRGGEGALLIGATYPELVTGVIAAVPSSVVVCGFPDCGEPAWTLAGRPVPFTRKPGIVPPDDPRAEIPVERIRGPVLVDCGDLDTIWPSCNYAEAVERRRAAHHLRTVLQHCATCDHFVDGVPGEPFDAVDRARGDDQEVMSFFSAGLSLLESSGT